MIVDKLYLVTCKKDYPAFTGDSTEEIIKLLVPAQSKKAAEDNVIARKIDLGIDRISDSVLLYETVDGQGRGKDGNWKVIQGFNSEQIIRV